MNTKKKRTVAYTALLVTIALLMATFLPLMPLATETEALSVKEKINNFLTVICPLAEEDMKSSDILASLTIAQAIIESGWGTSYLATIGNNLFGIKAYSTWKGKAYSTATKKVYSSYSAAKAKGGVIYRAYDSWKDSVADHSNVFNTNSIYKGLRGLTDYKKAARIIVDSGYAGKQTDYHYADNLVYLIEHYGLTKYDNGVSSGTTTTTKPSTQLTVPSSITLNVKEITLGIGAEFELKATVSPSKADQTVKWSSSDKSVVTVSSGKMTAKSAGTAKITARTSNGIKVVCTVTVKNNFDFIITGKKLVSCFSEDEIVEIPYGVTAIEAYAFKNCLSKTVIIPETAKDISSRAFNDKDIIVQAKKGSVAESMAKDSGMSFKSLFDKEWMLSSDPKMLTGMVENTSVGMLLSYFSSEKDLELFDSVGNSIKENALWSLSTGYVAEIGGQKYKVVVKGDTNGDSKVSEKDCERIAGQMIGTVELSGAGLMAADIDYDGEVNITDYVKARAYLYNGVDIY